MRSGAKLQRRYVTQLQTHENHNRPTRYPAPVWCWANKIIAVLRKHNASVDGDVCPDTADYEEREEEILRWCPAKEDDAECVQRDNQGGHCD